MNKLEKRLTELLEKVIKLEEEKTSFQNDYEFEKESDEYRLNEFSLRMSKIEKDSQSESVVSKNLPDFEDEYSDFETSFESEEEYRTRSRQIRTLRKDNE